MTYSRISAPSPPEDVSRQALPEAELPNLDAIEPIAAGTRPAHLEDAFIDTLLDFLIRKEVLGAAEEARILLLSEHPEDKLIGEGLEELSQSSPPPARSGRGVWM